MLNKKTVDDINVKGKRVLVRCDFNVPLIDGKITDENRLVAALPTIKKLIADGGKVILCSHLGKPKGEPKPELSLAPVAKRLTELLGQEVKFVPSPVVVDDTVKAAVADMKDGEVILLENTRYRAEETKNGEEFSKELASLCDVFVNDAFGTAHRAHCSNVGVTKFVDTAVVGYLMQKEIDFLGNAVNNPERPFVAILGGAKVSSKISVIENLLEKVDTLIIGGGMAYTFLKAQGYEDSQIEYKCAAGDSTALTTIVTNMTDGTYDMVFTIATPPTQAMVNTETDTPVFFCAVSAPVAAGVITDMDKPDKNATGTSNAIPVSDIIDFAQSVTPTKKVGIIYSGNEDNATNTAKQCEEYLDKTSVEYVEKTAPTSNDVESATNALVAEGVDMIFIPNDSIIQDGISTLTDICKEKKIPTYCSSATTVASGCFATLAIDDKGIGKKTVDIAMDYVNGKKVEDIPAQVVGIDYCTVNKATMEALGISEDNIKTDYEVKLIEN